MNMPHRNDQFDDVSPVRTYCYDIEVRPFADQKRQKAIDSTRIEIRQIGMASRRIADDHLDLAAWLCLVVRPYSEFSTVKAMINEDIDAFVPTYVGPDVRKRGRIISGSVQPVMPGYVLVRCVPKHEATRGLLHFRVSGARKRSVTDIIGGAETPYRFRHDIIAKFLDDAKSGTYDFRPPDPTVYSPGEAVRVTSGPFASFLAEVIDWDGVRNRVKVEVSIFGRSTPVDLDVAQIEKL